MNVTWLGVIVIAVFALTAVRGYQRGFIREVVSFFFVFLAVAIAWAINPYVNDFFMENTPVYEKIQESCEGFIASSQEDGEADTQSAGEKDQDQFQKNFIESLGLPSVLNQGMEANNREDVYSYLAVDTFGQYVSSYLARTIVNGLSFLLSYILASVVLRFGTYILNLIAQLPLLHGANKLTGALVGLVKGILFVWIGFLILTILCSTEAGKTGLALIEQDPFLSVLYRYDIFVNVFMSIFYGS